MNVGRWFAVALLLLAVLAAVAVGFRHRLMIFALATGEPPPLLDAQEEGPGVVWFDDYFTIEQLDERTWAIGEPRYDQQVFNYLIVGRRRALLFDAGTGLRDIRPVVAALTDLPLTFMPSHLHYDHIGNEVTFEHVALVDLPALRARAPDDRLTPTWAEHLGSAEGYAIPTLEIDEWVAPGDYLELGGRRLKLLYTPGHTSDSVSLLDEQRGLMFSGDFLYEGPLFAFLPNSSLAAYLDAAGAVLEVAPEALRIYGAHRTSPPGAPRLGIEDVRALRAALEGVRDHTIAGRGRYPVVYPVNARLELWAQPRWLQDW
ncbi:MAG: MBL fold metallo-hydrolase [Pseudomonadales bacterium]|jgi:glyoxylase-like metal-dependent hydrolase (beta-lactamase superfamily II)|nr:MBL fold metallo-hydrolase [Pseudomonadales bacterium]